MTSDMVFGMRLGFEQEVDGTYTVGSPLSLVFFKTGMVTDTSRHSYGRTEGIMLNFIDEMSGIGLCALHTEYYQFCGNFCFNPETGKVQ